ncbi:MAG: glycosyltransferase family 2 protein [Saprospiraceae bacterium]|nr:glycosyltransferase family 2 protein [Pyrinomonadaceae bacterium]
MIDILMSTYNGAAFLGPQIDSILGQSHSDFRLLIRDDGSTDDTVATINGYASKDSRIIYIVDERENLGAPASFMSLAALSEAPLFMLSDQDDVWLPDKISRTLGKMSEMSEKYREETPLAVFTDLTVVDEKLDVISESFWKHQKLDPDLCRDWKKILAQNVVTGCTLMVNKAAVSVILPFALPGMMHDHWIAANVAKYGQIDYLSDPAVLYRQHSRNVEGVKHFGVKYALSKMPRLIEKAAFYSRASKIFGDVSAAELFINKISLNIKRF